MIRTWHDVAVTSAHENNHGNGAGLPRVPSIPLSDDASTPGDQSIGGLVKDAAQYPLLEARAREACAQLGWQVRGYFESPITGGDGNKEFFLWASNTP